MDEHQQGETLSDYSDIAWHAVLREKALDVTVETAKSLKITIDGSKTAELAQEILRSPRKIIVTAGEFESNHAACYHKIKRDVPLMPVTEPWSQERKKGLQKEVIDCIKRVLTQAVNQAVIRKEHVNVSSSGITSELLGEIEKSWEQGRRKHYEASQDSDVSNPLPAQLLKVTESRGRKKKGKPSTEELLKELVSTKAGREKIIAARTIDGIADLIGRSHGSVAGTTIWREKIKPMLDRLKAEEKLARYESDERRQDRHEND